MKRVFLIALLMFAVLLPGQVIGPRRMCPWPVPAAHWRLSGASADGLWHDSIGTNHLRNAHSNGVPVGSNQVNAVLDYSAGFATNSQSYLWVSNSWTAAFPSNSWTVALWMNPTNFYPASFGGYLIGTRQGNNGWAIDISTNFTPQWIFTRFYYYNGGFKYTTQVTNPPLYSNTWNLIIAWRSGTADWCVRTYTPTSPAGTTTNLGAPSSPVPGTALRISSGYDLTTPANFLQGILLDEITIWTNVLTTNQMDALWNGGRGAVGAFITDRN